MTRPTSSAESKATWEARWPLKRCVSLGFALGLLAVTIIAVATSDAVSAALGGAFTVLLTLLVAAPIWEDEDA